VPHSSNTATVRFVWLHAEAAAPRFVAFLFDNNSTLFSRGLKSFSKSKSLLERRAIYFVFFFSFHM
jgi:hypothetical protein